MDFTEHGSYQVIAKGNVIEASLSGAFNKEAIVKYCKAIDEEITDAIEAGFFIVLDLSDVEGATPEAWEVAGQHNLWLSKQNLLAKAIVCKQEHVATYARRYNQSSLSDRIEYFSELEDAREWIRTKGKG